jgi:hypothetical protein
MRQSKLIPGNLRTDVMIKEKDQHFYHVLMTSVRINKEDALHPIVKTSVRPFRTNDYRKYFKCKTEDQIAFLHSMGVDTAETVHNPNLNNKKEITDPVSLTDPVKIDSAKAAEDARIEEENRLIKEAQAAELAAKEDRIKASNRTPRKKQLKIR